MTMDLSAFAALAIAGFMFGFVGLLLLMLLVQPIWCVIDCAVDNRRGTVGKIVWIIVLIVFYGVANWFYGAFAASGRALRWLTRLAWLVAIALIVAFAVMFFNVVEFRRGIEQQWHQRRGMTAMQATDPASVAQRGPALKLTLALKPAFALKQSH